MRSERGEQTSRPWEPERSRQDAQSPAAKRPEGAVVFFLLETVPPWELRRFEAPQEPETRGAPPSDPARLVCLVLSASWGGVWSSRKIAWACARPLAFLALVGQDRPAFRPSSAGRTRPLEACQDGGVQGGRVAAEAGLGPWGHGATEGTKIQGHASRHQARSSGEMQQDVARLRADIAALGTPAYPQDEADEAAVGRWRGDALPGAWACRAARLARIEAALRRGAAPAKAHAEAERQRRADAEAERQRTGQQRRGKAPTPGEDSPADQGQSPLTDPELPLMRPPNKGWDSGGQAPARVEGACQLIGACEVTEAAPDKQPAEPGAQATRAPRTQAGRERPQEAPGAVPARAATVDQGDDSAAAGVALET